MCPECYIGLSKLTIIGLRNLYFILDFFQRVKMSGNPNIIQLMIHGFQYFLSVARL